MFSGSVCVFRFSIAGSPHGHPPFAGIANYLAAGSIATMFTSCLSDRFEIQCSVKFGLTHESNIDLTLDPFRPWSAAKIFGFKLVVALAFAFHARQLSLCPARSQLRPPPQGFSYLSFQGHARLAVVFCFGA